MYNERCEKMIKKPDLSVYVESVDYIKSKIETIPEIAIILGSGLGGIAESLDDPVIMPYNSIPNFPNITILYHKGDLICGKLKNKNVLVMNGRFHYYEGYEMWEIAYPIAVIKLLGIKKLIITNASGGIGENIRIGDLVCIKDHIKLAPDSPERGSNISILGERFFDMQSVYDSQMRTLAHKKARELDIELKDGIYAYMSGPQYETPAEINMLRILGATTVGMSTVPEVIEAAHCKIPVLCISCVTNMAAGITGASISEREVLDTGKIISKKLILLLQSLIEIL